MSIAADDGSWRDSATGGCCRQPSGRARPIGVFPVVRDPGFAEHESHEIREACLSPDIVGEQQHATSAALQAHEAVGGLTVVAALVESPALGSFEHDDAQPG